MLNLNEKILSNILEGLAKSLEAVYVGLFYKEYPIKLITDISEERLKKINFFLGRLIQKSLEINKIIKDFKEEFLFVEGSEISIYIQFIGENISLVSIVDGSKRFSIVRLENDIAKRKLTKYLSDINQFAEKYIEENPKIVEDFKKLEEELLEQLFNKKSEKIIEKSIILEREEKKEEKKEEKIKEEKKIEKEKKEKDSLLKIKEQLKEKRKKKLKSISKSVEDIEKPKDKEGKIVKPEKEEKAKDFIDTDFFEIKGLIPEENKKEEKEKDIFKELIDKDIQKGVVSSIPEPKTETTPKIEETIEISPTDIFEEIRGEEKEEKKEEPKEEEKVSDVLEPEIIFDELLKDELEKKGKEINPLEEEIEEQKETALEDVEVKEDREEKPILEVENLENIIDEVGEEIEKEKEKREHIDEKDFMELKSLISDIGEEKEEKKEEEDLIEQEKEKSETEDKEEEKENEGEVKYLNYLVLDILLKAFAKEVGPIAKVIFKRKIRELNIKKTKLTNKAVKQLINALAEEIPIEYRKQRFLDRAKQLL